MDILLKSAGRASIAGLLICSVVAGFAAQALAAGPKKYAIGLAADIYTPANKAYIAEFTKLIKSNTDGLIVATATPADKVGTDEQAIERLFGGAALLYLVPPEKLTVVDPAFRFALAPGMVDSLKHAPPSAGVSTYYTALKKLNASEVKIVPISHFINVPVMFFTHKKVKSFDDLQGLKMRVAGSSPIEYDFIRAMGGTGIANKYGVTAPPPADSLVDGAWLPITKAFQYGWQKKVSTAVVSRLAHTSTLAILGQEWLKKLPRDLQNSVLKTGSDVNLWAAEKNAERVDDAVKKWEDFGVTIYPVSKVAEYKIKLEAPLWLPGLYKNKAATELYKSLMEAQGKG